MTALTGRTNAKHITVKLDIAAGTFTDISAYVSSVGTVGLTHETTDVTAYSDGVKNVTIGQPSAPIQLSGPFDTTMHGYMTGYTDGRQTDASGLSFDVYIGVRTTWESGAPCFGITGSASAGYQVTSYTVDGSGMTWSATLQPFGSTAPAWATTAHT